MVLQLSIEKAAVSTFQGDKGPVTMIQVVMTDKTKPAIFRAKTYFVLNMMPDSYRKHFQHLQVEDEPVTVLVSDMAGSGTMIKLKGDIIKGWASHEQIEALARTMSQMPMTLEEIQEQQRNAAALAPSSKEATQKKAA